MTKISMTWPQYQRRECTIKGKVIFLTPIQCKIIFIMLVNRGKSISLTNMITYIWPDPDKEPNYPENNFYVHMTYLKRVIGNDIITQRNSFGWSIEK
jgi:DNA-binding response OmpR family regulator